MIAVVESIDIAADPVTVWTAITDYRRDVTWRSGVVSMEPSVPGPLAPGITTSEEMRFLGRTMRNDAIVVDVEPGHSFHWRTTSGVDANGSRTVVSDGGITTTTLALAVRPSGMDRLTAPLLRRLLSRSLRRDLRRLRDQIERGDRPADG